ncbi:ABC transporter ATP-binding protein [soil metagenome]
MNVIELRGLQKHYGTFRAVDGLDLTVRQGDVYGFLGPNGAGKSTTIRMMMSLIRPTSGSITVFGESLHHHREKILRRIGAIVERPDFYNYLSAFKNLELVGRLSGADVSRTNIIRVLGMVSLDERAMSKVKTYSHGMKQRLGIAQALLHNPDLIVLDEPTTGLDPQGMKDIRDLILALSADHKKTILLSSHILPEVELTANRMVIINKGKAVVEGLVNDLLNAGKMKVTIETDECASVRTALSTTPWGGRITGVTEHAVIMQLDRAEIASVIQHLSASSIHINSVVPVRSLEDYFLSLTSEVV